MKPPPLGTEVALRAAGVADLASISRVINFPPEPPSATLLGSRRASRVGDLFVRAGAFISLRHTTVAVLHGGIVGVMDCGGQQAVNFGPMTYIRLLPRLLWILGPVMPRAVRGTLARQRLQFDAVPGAFSVGALYVDETVRSRGIGGALLLYAGELAQAVGAPRMSLETGVANPARRLYERHGYHVVATKTDAVYERLTGSPGRILMVKELTAPSPAQADSGTGAVAARVAARRCLG